MRSKFLLALGLLIGLGTASISSADATTTSVSTANVNLRAGPSTAYPALTVVPAGTRIVTYGCLPGYTWCDIGFAGYRGWVSARYIQVVYQGGPVILTPGVASAVGVTVVAFNRTYWDTYYTAYPWYGRWGAYPPPPYAGSHSVSGGCANGSCTVNRSTTGPYGGSTSQTRTCSGGECTATRHTVGPYGGSATRTRSCSQNSASCTVNRSGPRGTRSRTFAR